MLWNCYNNGSGPDPAKSTAAHPAYRAVPPRFFWAECLWGCSFPVAAACPCHFPVVCGMLFTPLNNPEILGGSPARLARADSLNPCPARTNGVDKQCVPPERLSCRLARVRVFTLGSRFCGRQNNRNVTVIQCPPGVTARSTRGREQGRRTVPLSAVPAAARRLLRPAVSASRPRQRRRPSCHRRARQCWRRGPRIHAAPSPGPA